MTSAPERVPERKMGPSCSLSLPYFLYIARKHHCLPSPGGPGARWSHPLRSCPLFELGIKHGSGTSKLLLLHLYLSFPPPPKSSGWFTWHIPRIWSSQQPSEVVEAEKGWQAHYHPVSFMAAREFERGLPICCLPLEPLQIAACPPPKLTEVKWTTKNKVFKQWKMEKGTKELFHLGQHLGPALGRMCFAFRRSNFQDHWHLKDLCMGSRDITVQPVPVNTWSNGNKLWRSKTWPTVLNVFQKINS